MSLGEGEFWLLEPLDGGGVLRTNFPLFWPFRFAGGMYLPRKKNIVIIIDLSCFILYSYR